LLPAPPPQLGLWLPDNNNTASLLCKRRKLLLWRPEQLGRAALRSLKFQWLTASQETGACIATYQPICLLTQHLITQSMIYTSGYRERAALHSCVTRQLRVRKSRSLDFWDTNERDWGYIKPFDSSSILIHLINSLPHSSSSNSSYAHSRTQVSIAIYNTLQHASLLIQVRELIPKRKVLQSK